MFCGEFQQPESMEERTYSGALAQFNECNDYTVKKTLWESCNLLLSSGVPRFNHTDRTGIMCFPKRRFTTICDLVTTKTPLEICCVYAAHRSCVTSNPISRMFLFVSCIEIDPFLRLDSFVSLCFHAMTLVRLFWHGTRVENRPAIP